MSSGFSIAGPDEDAGAYALDQLHDGKGLSGSGKRVSDMCKVLSETDRLRVLCLLHRQEECVEDMCEKMNISQPGLSHHLALMRTAGILKNDHRGRYQFYSIAESGKSALRNSGEALRRIRSFGIPEEYPPAETPLSIDQLLDQDCAVSAVGVELAKRLKVIGEETRMMILLLLSGGEMNVTDLCTRLKESQPAVSHHLSLMKKAALVIPRRAGKKSYYSILPAGGDRIHQAGNILQKFAADPHPDTGSATCMS